MNGWSAILDLLEYRYDKLRCRLFRIHGPSCRGRSDHVRNGQIIDADRWRP